MSDTENLNKSLPSRLLGTFAYTPPGWLTDPHRRRRARRGLFAALTIAGVTAALGYALRPPAANVTVTVTAPDITPIVDDEPQPLPLTIHIEPATETGIQSPAPLGAIGRPLVDVAQIQPALDGQWQWHDDTTLKFQPAADWAAGRRYRIAFEPSAFAEDVRLPSGPVVFSTPPLSARVDGLRFHQDPVRPHDRRVVATIVFSHPVHPSSLADHIRLTLMPPSARPGTPPQDLAAQISRDRHGRQVFVRSGLLTLPEVETFARLTVDKGVEAAAGVARLREALTGEVLVPDRDSWFRVAAVDSFIARDARDTPAQTLAIRFTDRVATAEAAQAVEAWLLPADHQFNGTRHRRFFWRSASQVTPEVLARAEPIALEINPTQSVDDALQSFRFRAPEERFVLVRVRAGLETGSNFVLAADHDAVVAVPDWPREVRIAREGGLLPLTGRRELAVVARGLATLRVEVGRLLDDRINHLVSQTGGDIANPWFSNHQFGENDITTRRTRYIDLAAADPSAAVYATLDLDERTGAGGFFFVTVSGWDRTRGAVVGPTDRRFVLVTDLSLLAKTGADGRQDVFVHGIDANAPVAGARVMLLGRNGLPVLQGITDDLGHLALPSARGLKNEREPVAYLVRRGQDAAFMPYQRHGRQLDYSRFDAGGAYDDADPDALRVRAQVFTDRGLYRPGETAHVGAVVKRGDWAPLDGLPVTLEIADPRGQTVVERRTRLPDNGLTDWTFALADTAPTGNWQATVFRPRSDNAQRIVLGNVSFRVADYEPDRTRITVALDDAQDARWLRPARIGASVRLTNLFGTPAAGRRVTARARLVPATLAPPGFDDYRFVDPLRQPGRTPVPVHIPVADSTSDADGLARLAIPVADYDTGIYRLEVTAEGFEPGGGRSVSAGAAVLMSPLPMVVGFRADGNLDFIHRDTPRALTFVAVDRSGGAVALDDGRLALAEVREISSLVQQPDGTYSYESAPVEVPLSQTPLRIRADGTRVPLPTNTAGRFVARVTDGAGTSLARVAFRVAGARNLAGRLEGGAELELTLNRDTYAAGDTISVQMTTPYTGRGLISVESDRVHAWRWFDARTTATVQTIDVPADVEGNAYVNVALIRDLESQEVFVRPLSYAVAPFRVDAGSRRLDIRLEVPDSVRPGNMLSVRYASDRPGRIIVFAVDEGILQAAGYADPDPLALFLRKQALRVSTHQIVDLVIPDFDVTQNASAPGGGDGAARSGRNFNPFNRGNRPPVVFWSGVVDAGPAPAEQLFEVPDDFNGGLRILAVAATGGATGAARSQTVSRGPFVVLPSLPAAVAPGDEFEVAVGLANNQTDVTGPVSLTLTPSNQLTVVGPQTISLAVAPGSEARTRFRVRAGDVPGAASLMFTAVGGDDSARLTAYTSVRPATPHATVLSTGRVDGRTQTLAPARDLYPDLAHRHLDTSPGPLVLAAGLQQYLWQFVHQCAEQMVSRVFPQIGLSRTHPALVDQARLNAQFDRLIDALRSRQNPDGGFAFWPGAAQSAEFVSVYILHFLTDAAELGLAVPPRMLAAGQTYLEQLAARPDGDLPVQRVRAYAIYVLTRGGRVTTSYLTQQQEYLEREYVQVWRADIVSAWMAAGYALLRDQALSSQLIAGYRPGQGPDGDLDTASTRDAQFLYLLARHFPDRPGADGDALVESLTDAVSAGRFDTLNSAYIVLALGEHTRAMAGNGTETRLTGIDAGGTTHPLASGVGPVVGTDLLPRTAQVRIDGPDGLFYALTEAGFDRPAGVLPTRNGLQIAREYLDADGVPVTTAMLGDELSVRLTVRSTAGVVDNVAIVDLLPGGFAIVPGGGTNLAAQPWVDYAEVRDDRLVVYGRIGERQTELVYRVKATAAGRFTIPVAQAAAMYRRDLIGRTGIGQFVVDSPP